MKFQYVETSQVFENEISKQGKRLASYIDLLNKVASTKDYLFDESSINLPLDDAYVNHILKLKGKLTSKELKYILVIGIGGADLGTKAIYDALWGSFDLVEPDRFPKMIFLDVTDPKFLSKLKEFLNKNINKPKEIIINTVSKSGKTIETIANLEIILKDVRFSKERMVITTGYKTELWDTANKMEIDILPIPDKVGDRFSIFSALGLFPLACAGISIEKFREGARMARLDGLKKDIYKNLPALSALITFSNLKRGCTIHNTFLFNPELESLGKWYRQLVAESLGKKRTGITPTVSIGSRDLHSMAQLYLAGPRDKFFTFVSTKGVKHPIRVPNDSVELLTDVISEIEGKTADEITRAILLATKQTFNKHELPYAEIILDEISEKSLGHFMQFKMLEIMYLGRLLKVDAFSQPNVEEYKTEAKKILSQE